ILTFLRSTANMTSTTTDSRVQLEDSSQHQSISIPVNLSQFVSSDQHTSSLQINQSRTKKFKSSKSQRHAHRKPKCIDSQPEIMESIVWQFTVRFIVNHGLPEVKEVGGSKAIPKRLHEAYLKYIDGLFDFKEVIVGGGDHGVERTVVRAFLADRRPGAKWLTRLLCPVDSGSRGGKTDSQQGDEIDSVCSSTMQLLH
ncbi:hypothetical protein HDU76_010606, partial [Blyttiomyces sp. JEL0837]